MINSGKCSLIIKGNKLNFEEIELNLKITPSRVIKKGELISNVIGKSHYDFWIFDYAFYENVLPDKAMSNLLSMLTLSKHYLQRLACTEDVRIKLFVQSDYAQISFELPPYVIQELVNINVKLDISILSWGGVNP